MMVQCHNENCLNSFCHDCYEIVCMGWIGVFFFLVSFWNSKLLCDMFFFCFVSFLLLIKNHLYLSLSFLTHSGKRDPENAVLQLLVAA
jgi:hypothetical protein